MATVTSTVQTQTGKPSAARFGWALLILLTLYACYFRHLGAIGFVGPDEPRYAWIAREMAESGDWITPRLYGKPWFEKPPLYYWGAALSFRLFGVNETAARLLSAISALLATLALAWLAWRLYGGETARWLLLLLPTTVGMIGFSHAAATDMPFSATLTIAMVGAAALLGLIPPPGGFSSPGLHPYATSVRAVLFGFFLGLAVLAKGPAAVVLCGGVVLLWALLTKRWRDALRLLHPAAIIAFCVTALPWYVLCARRNPDFFHIFIIEHNFKRYLTPEFQHVQPFWFYLPIPLAALLPWTLFLVPALGDLGRSLRTRLHSGAPWIFLASWALFVCAFFSVSQSKLPGYILPAVPPLVLLCCVACTRLAATKSRFSLAVLSATCVAALILIAVGLDYALGSLRLSDLRAVADYFPLGLPMAGLVALLILVVPAVALVRYRTGSLVAVVLAIAGVLLFTPLKRLDAALSPRQTAQALAALKKPGEQVLVCDMRRSYIYGFNFYLREEVLDWSQRDRAKPALVVIGSPACWSEMRGADYHLRSESDLVRWQIAEVKPDQRAALPLAGSRNKK